MQDVMYSAVAINQRPIKRKDFRLQCSNLQHLRPNDSHFESDDEHTGCVNNGTCLAAAHQGKATCLNIVREPILLDYCKVLSGVAMGKVSRVRFENVVCPILACL